MPQKSSYWLDSEALTFFSAQQTTAYRVYSEGNWRWIERYGDDCLIAQTHPPSSKHPAILTEPASAQLLASQLQNWARTHRLPIHRIFFQAVDPKLREAPRLIFGPEEGGASECKSTEGMFTGSAMELGLHYHIDWRGLTGRGLFIDQRENRIFLANLLRSQASSAAKPAPAFKTNSKPVQLLNLFAYTCSFSVVAAHAGAITTNIDLSRPALDRGRENLRLNGLDPGKHFFHAADVRDSLPFLAKKGLKFDIIILDPPTFSKSKSGKPFQVECDFFVMLEQALACAERGAHILLSTNCRTLSQPLLRKGAEESLRRMGIQAAFLKAPDPIDIPACHRPTTFWLKLCG